MKTIPNESIDLVLFDPPYGVNLQDGGKTPKGNWVDGWAKTYDDTTQNAILLMDGVLEQIARVLKPGAHCYLFFALQLEIETRAISETIQKYLNYQRSPLMWVKNTHSNKDPYKRFGITYEPIYFCWKGGTPRDLMKAHHSVFNIPVNTKGKQHPNEKPEELYKKLISLSTHPKEVVLDPTAGSGRSLTSAVQLGRHPIGIEKDSDWFNLMESNIRAAKEERDGRKS
jgi:site-specific DNA-methyltransferase (adenine-specific)